MTFYMQISCRQLFSHLFWAYMTLVAFHHFGQPLILSTAAAAVTRPPGLSPSARKSLSSTASVTTAPYVRKSRDTGGLSATSAPESIDGQEQFGGLTSSALSSNAGGGFYPYPSFKHPRVARFHGEGSFPASRSYSIRSMTSFPKLNPLAGILSMKSSEMKQPTQEELLEDEDPTFTPFISARALSNIPQFFQHLRDNLEALQFDDDEGDAIHHDRLLGQSADALFPYGNDEEGRLNIPRLPEKPMRWMPATAGMVGHGRAHIRHFVNNPAEQDLFYKKPANNPARNRNVYEFGLG